MRYWLSKPLLTAAALGFPLALAVEVPAQMPSPEELQQLLEQVQQDPARLQRLMQQGQAMQSCMAQLDQPTMEALRARGEAMTAEVRQLCDKQQRDEAARRALVYAREISTSPAVQSVQQCGELAQQLMADLPFAAPGQTDDGASAHVCDQLPN
jgi:hypothetical protein